MYSDYPYRSRIRGIHKDIDIANREPIPYLSWFQVISGALSIVSTFKCTYLYIKYSLLILIVLSYIYLIL